jgi:hypothetical protein
MGQRIEQSDIAGVLSVYDFHDLPKFGIFHQKQPVVIYDADGTLEDGRQKLSDYLDMIENGGSTAVYELRVYDDSCHNINSKTGYKGATSFQINSDKRAEYTKGPDGNVIMVRERNNGMSGLSGNNSLMQMLMDQNKQTQIMLQALIKEREDKKFDLLLEALKAKAEPAKESWQEQLAGLGKLIIDKPDVIDRIGYIFKPGIYQVQQAEQAAAAQVTGTENKAPAPDPVKEMETIMDKITSEPLTEAQEQLLDDRCSAALEIMESSMGLEDMVKLLERVAQLPPAKLEKLKPDMIDKVAIFI